MPTWKSPYENLPKLRRFPLQADVDLADHQLIKSTAVAHGIVTKFIQTIYHDVAQYARDNSLSYLDSDAFVDYLRQRATAYAASKAGARDDGDRGQGVYQNPPSSTNESPAVHQAPESRLRSIKAAVKKGRGKRVGEEEVD